MPEKNILWKYVDRITPVTECFGQDFLGIMTDNELWKLAIADLRRELSALDPDRIALVRGAAADIIDKKRALFAISAQVNGESICAACRGECCTTGKYHVTVIDIMVMLLDKVTIFEPSFGSGRCPYLVVDNGCLMHPSYRPFNCITFNCERIEELCEPILAAGVLAEEERLRGAYQRFEALFGRRLWEGVLHFAEREFQAN